MSKKVSFKEVINGDQPVFVDFYAEWCGPCQALAPVIQQVASEVEGIAHVIKIDIDKNPAIAQKLNIQSIPTLVIYRKGEVVWRHVGGASKSSMVAAIKEAAK